MLRYGLQPLMQWIMGALPRTLWGVFPYGIWPLMLWVICRCRYSVWSLHVAPLPHPTSRHHRVSLCYPGYTLFWGWNMPVLLPLDPQRRFSLTYLPKVLIWCLNLYHLLAPPNQTDQSTNASSYENVTRDAFYPFLVLKQPLDSWSGALSLQKIDFC